MSEENNDKKLPKEFLLHGNSPYERKAMLG